MVTFPLSAIDRSVARSCEWQIREWWKLPPGETMQVSRGTAVGRKAPGRAQQQLLMDGTAVESAFALLLAKVTKLPYPAENVFKLKNTL